LGGFHQRPMRLGCDNVATFGRQNSRNAHLRLPLFGRHITATPGESMRRSSRKRKTHPITVF
jgi:hypothetical protein